MTDAPFTRYFCPLECGWHYDLDQPKPGDGLPEPLVQQPGETFQDLITRAAGETARAHLKQADDALREHLNTHTVLQAVTKAAEFRDERDQARQANLDGDIYSAINSFQQTANWPQLRLAQMRQHLAEHIARELSASRS